MTKPIPDRAEIALEYPDKFYSGTFERSARFEAHLDQTGITLVLERTGSEDVRKSIHIHLHFGLFADILRDLAATVGKMDKDDVTHREALASAAEALYRALVHKPSGKRHERAQPSDRRGGRRFDRCDFAVGRLAGTEGAQRRAPALIWRVLSARNVTPCVQPSSTRRIRARQALKASLRRHPE